jgi:transcriptional regulator with XRE-family HTH domain
LYLVVFAFNSHQLAARRSKAGLTQAELGDKAGISPEMVARAERGEKKPSMEVAEQLAAALDCDLWELCTVIKDFRIVEPRERVAS